MYGKVINRNNSNPPLIVETICRQLISQTNVLSKTAGSKIISKRVKALNDEGYDLTIKQIKIEIDILKNTPFHVRHQATPVSIPNPAGRSGLSNQVVLPSSNDRMLRSMKNPHCPECDAHPVVCAMRRGPYRKFRCRTCEHIWEIGGPESKEDA